jgi:hypothetical protein
LRTAIAPFSQFEVANQFAVARSVFKPEPTTKPNSPKHVICVLGEVDQLPAVAPTNMANIPFTRQARIIYEKFEKFKVWAFSLMF